MKSRVQLFATPWTVAYQDPPSMGFSRQEYWSGSPVPSPEVASKDNSLLTVHCHPGKENRLLLTTGHFKVQNKSNGWNSIMWQMLILLLSLFIFLSNNWIVTLMSVFSAAALLVWQHDKHLSVPSGTYLSLLMFSRSWLQWTDLGSSIDSTSVTFGKVSFMEFNSSQFR